MARNAEEGFALYKELFLLGVDLEFLKEHHIDTDSYRKQCKESSMYRLPQEIEQPTK